MATNVEIEPDPIRQNLRPGGKHTKCEALTAGMLGGFIWKFRKNFAGGTLQIVAEVYKNECYAITGYWLRE